MIHIFDWVADIVVAIGDTVSQTVTSMGEAIAKSIFGAFLQWIYEMIYGAVADFFSYISIMGAEIFELNWVKATIQLFACFGWALFIAGTIVAIFDVAIEYQSGRANIKNTSLNILKGFFACSLIGVVPVELYKLCISLQNTFSHDLATIVGANARKNIGDLCIDILKNIFDASVDASLLSLCCLIAFAYCVIKIFFQNIKRGGVLLVQISVGSLYMFSVPRGYMEGFIQWVKHIAGLCLTAFMQTTMLYLGLLTFPTSVLLGIGIMLAAGEVPKVAEQFGLDSSFRIQDLTSVVYATSSITNVGKTIIRAR